MELYHIITAISIFIIIYGVIISEKINRTTIAVFGATMLLLFKIITQEKAIETIDFNTIGLLIGMMIIVNILRRTGAFEYLAIKAAKTVGGEPWKIIVVFSIFTAVASALLDNVTTILLMVPITLVITETLELSPIPFVLPLILSSNIGGTATLIGDPPNIIIGSQAKLSFNDFIASSKCDSTIPTDFNAASPEFSIFSKCDVRNLVRSLDSPKVLSIPLMTLFTSDVLFANSKR